MLNKFSLNLDKKSVLYLIVVIFAFFFALGLIYFISQRPAIEEIIKERPLPAEKTLKEVIKDLTVPEGVEIEPLPEKVIKDLTAPKGKKVESLPEEVIKDLTVPQ